jgi:hypothetical protein
MASARREFLQSMPVKKNRSHRASRFFVVFFFSLILDIFDQFCEFIAEPAFENLADELKIY